MAKYIKAHTIGYIPVEKKRDRKDHFGEQKKYVQVIKMKNGQVRSIQHYY